MAGDRRSEDPLDRIEWQVDQIRQAVFVLAAVVTFLVVIAVIAAFSG